MTNSLLPMGDWSDLLCFASPTPSLFDITKRCSSGLTHIPPPPTASFCCPSALFHPPAFVWCSKDLSTPSFVSPTLSLFDVTNDVQTAWDTFLHPLLPRSATPLLCFTHPPLFDIPTTFPPPLLCFAHPIPIWCHYGIKQHSNHLASILPPPTFSFCCPFTLFHPPTLVQCSNDLTSIPPTATSSFCCPVHHVSFLACHFCHASFPRMSFPCTFLPITPLHTCIYNLMTSSLFDISWIHGNSEAALPHVPIDNTVSSYSYYFTIHSLVAYVVPIL